jgi:hypothetical protein
VRENDLPQSGKWQQNFFLDSVKGDLAQELELEVEVDEMEADLVLAGAMVREGPFLAFSVSCVHLLDLAVAEGRRRLWEEIAKRGVEGDEGSLGICSVGTLGISKPPDLQTLQTIN